MSKDYQNKDYYYYYYYYYKLFKERCKVRSAHNKGELTDIDIAQILHLSNYFEFLKTSILCTI